MALARWKDLCVDASDPRTVAAFWSSLPGLEAEPAGDGVTRLHGESPEWHVLADPRARVLRVHLLVGSVP